MDIGAAQFSCPDIIIIVFQTITSSSRSIEMDIGAVEGGQKKEQFDGAIHLLKTQKYVQCCNIFPFISKEYV